MRSKTKPRRAMGPKTLTGSTEAKRLATGILEILSGLRGPTDGSEALGISLTRYYQLETRALQGMIAALEPLPKGKRKTPEAELDRLRREKRRLEQELGRSQALLRAAQRSIGLRSVSKKKPGKLGARPGTTKKKRRTMARGLKAIETLRQGVEEKPPAAAAS